MNEFDGTTILIVDDEEMIREIFQSFLSRLGARVLEAQNGRIALEIIKQNEIDLLITDVRMPGGDGLELLREIEKNSLKNFPIFVCSGYNDISTDEYKTLGIDQHIAKPFDWQDILKSIDAALSK